MVMMSWLLLAGAVLVVSVLAVLVYSGLWEHPSKVVERPLGPFTMVYKAVRGNYRNTGQAMMDVCKVMEKLGIAGGQGVGFYYDVPGRTADKDLRSIGGSVVKTELTEAQAEALKKEGMGVFRLATPLRTYATSFPWRTMISIFMGISKSYAALHKDERVNGLPKLCLSQVPTDLCTGGSVELYDAEKHCIWYCMPAEHMELLGVPEFFAVAH